METLPRKRENRKVKRRKTLVLVLLLCFLSLVGTAFLYFLPGYRAVTFATGEEAMLVLGDQVIKDAGIILEGGGQVLFPLYLFSEHIDQGAVWSEEEKTLSLVTNDKLIRMNTQQLTAYINREPVDLSFPLRTVEDELYLPLDFFLSFYPFEMSFIPEENIVVLDADGVRPYPAKSSTEVKLRQKPSPRSPYYKSLEEDADLLIFSEAEGWYRVRTQGGLVGYVPKKALRILAPLRLPEPELDFARNSPWKPVGEKINMTWEFAYRRPDPATIPPMPGVNVVSPTWFHLHDEEGKLRNIADPRYVTWAHERGYKVWALVTNDFDKDLTHAVLKSPSRRQRVMDQLLSFAALYDLDGINIDFENLHFEDRDRLTQFVREFTPLAHEQGLTVSIDVTIKSSSLNWSRIYDRAALAEIVDYVALMTYDEHWASSPVAGSVASLPWVEEGLKGVLEEVPPEKLLLGVPFYTRLWAEEMQEGGGVEVSSRALSMRAIENILEEKSAPVIWDNRAQQHYAEYMEDDIVYRVWLEDKESIRRRVELVQKYNLAGVASWRRGFEEPEIWDVIKEGLQH